MLVAVAPGRGSLDRRNFSSGSNYWGRSLGALVDRCSVASEALYRIDLRRGLPGLAVSKKAIPPIRAVEFGVWPLTEWVRVISAPI
jgi:hypothetical protein